MNNEVNCWKPSIDANQSGNQQPSPTHFFFIDVWGRFRDYPLREYSPHLWRGSASHPAVPFQEKGYDEGDDIVHASVRIEDCV